jgi:hypothetical protein
LPLTWGRLPPGRWPRVRCVMTPPCGFREPPAPGPARP